MGCSGSAATDLRTLQADVERLKALVPSNSHIMMDVQWHWTNLWFAGQAKNWPLALYQFNEARGHIQWLIKKSPIIRSSGPDREDVDIEGIFGGIDTRAPDTSRLFREINKMTAGAPRVKTRTALS